MQKIAFTIVLNGMPFIERQAEIIPKHFDRWYIVEGYARPVNDSRWCKGAPDTFHDHFLSNDGTTAFLDSIASDKIRILRKPAGTAWEGKVEMCNSFMAEVSDSILLEVDVDEFWPANVLADVFDYCEKHDDFDEMRFQSRFWVGPTWQIVNDGHYGDPPNGINRLWRVRKPTRFTSHVPPKLAGATKHLDKKFTSSRGWIHDHYAYVTEEQLAFKEKYYGYGGAVEGCKRLQALSGPTEVNLKDFLRWATNGTKAVKVPLADIFRHPQTDPANESPC